MAGLVKAPLVTDTMSWAGARGGGWLARLRTTPGRLRAGVALVVLLACGLGLVTGMVFAALDSGFTAIGGHDAPLVEQSNALYYAVSDMDAQVGNVLLTGSDPALAADQQQDLALYASDQQHAERGHQPRQRRGGAQRAEHGELDQRPARHHEQQAQRQRGRHRQRRDLAGGQRPVGVAAEHRHRAGREVDDPRPAEGQHHAERDPGDDHTGAEAQQDVQQYFFHCGHSS